MAFDFKKEHKELYLPGEKPEIVTVPKASYIAARGKGKPNDEDGEYHKAIGAITKSTFPTPGKSRRKNGRPSSVTPSGASRRTEVDSNIVIRELRQNDLGNSSSTVLTTERLILRPWEDADALDLYELAKDERVGPIAGWPPHKSTESSLGVIRTVFSAPETYAVCLKSDNKAIGCVGVMTGKRANRALDENEGEIGYWLGVPFWGRGLMPEAVDRVLRHAFRDLGLNALWGGYFNGNERSKRVLEKCGFKFHHTSENVHWALMNDIRTEHMMRLAKEDWEADRIFTAEGVLRIVKIADHPELKNEAAAWYSSKWHVPLEAYVESIEASFGGTVPSWYLCLDGKRIVGGMGVIENDFHDRKDLCPNVCAVYTESEYRGRGIAGALLDYVCRDMAAHGIGTLYLLTDHTGFYERYGWRFLCMAQGDGDDKPSRMYVHVS